MNHLEMDSMKRELLRISVLLINTTDGLSAV